MKTKSVLLRLDEADDEALTKEARARKVSKAELLRVFLHEGLAGFDRKHEDLINRVNIIDGRVAHILELAAVGAAMLSAICAGSVGSAGSLMRNWTVRMPAASTRFTHAALSTTA